MFFQITESVVIQGAFCLKKTKKQVLVKAAFVFPFNFVTLKCERRMTCRRCPHRTLKCSCPPGETHRRRFNASHPLPQIHHFYDKARLLVNTKTRLPNSIFFSAGTHRHAFQKFRSIQVVYLGKGSQSWCSGITECLCVSEGMRLAQTTSTSSPSFLF